MRWTEVSLLVSGFRRSWGHGQIEVALLRSLDLGDGQLRAVHHGVFNHLHVTLVHVVQIRREAGKGANVSIRGEECNMNQNADRDSYGSEALRIPSMELLFVLESWRGYGQFLSLTNVSYISSKRRDMSPIFGSAEAFWVARPSKAGPAWAALPPACWLTSSGHSLRNSSVWRAPGSGDEEVAFPLPTCWT